VKKDVIIAGGGMAGLPAGGDEGFVSTPKARFLAMQKTLPGLRGFYTAGQRVSPGSGLPSGVMTGRHTAQRVGKRDGKKFTASLPGVAK
jgi:hypothetical protein